MKCLKTYKEFNVDLLDTATAQAPTIASFPHQDEKMPMSDSTSLEKILVEQVRNLNPEITLKAGEVFCLATAKVWTTTFIEKINLENGNIHETNQLINCFPEMSNLRKKQALTMLFTGKVIDNNFLGYAHPDTPCPCQTDYTKGIRPWYSRYLIQFLIFDKLFYMPNRSLFFVLVRNTVFCENYPDVTRLKNVPENYLLKLKAIKDGN